MAAVDGFGPRLRDKVALVSGIASGQGRAAALLFARHGAKVVGCDLNGAGARAVADEAAASGADEFGGEIVAVEASVFDEESVGTWVDAAVSRFGRVDVLYNNAALSDFGLVHEMDLAKWHRVIEWELDGVFLGCKHAFPHMRRDTQGATSVINTASVSGLLSTLLPRMDGGMAHAAGKAGVIGLTRSLAHEYAPWGVRVNSISPGSVETPSLALGGYDTPDVYEAVVDKLCIKRRAQPIEIAFCALYLASDESAYVTGANFVIDGGWSCF